MHPGRALVHMTRTVRWFRNYPVGADEQLEFEPSRAWPARPAVISGSSVITRFIDCGQPTNSAPIG